MKKMLALALAILLILTETAAFAQFIVNPETNFQPIGPGTNIRPVPPIVTAPPRDPDRPVVTTAPNLPSAPVVTTAPNLPSAPVVTDKPNMTEPPQATLQPAGTALPEEDDGEYVQWNHNHQWSDWEVLVPADGTAMGRHKRVCLICGVQMVERFYSEHTLYRDIEDREDDVIKMQKALIEQGYLSGKADGKFGMMTQKAVRNFQRDHGFHQDGIAWDPVLKALYEVEEVHLEITDVVPPFARCAGETTASVANEGYSVTGVSWLHGGAAMAADELFVEGEIYTVQVSLLASEPEGKEYTASINGESAAVAYEPDGTAIAVTCAMVCSDGIGLGGDDNGMEGAIVSVRFERISELPASLAPGQSAKVTYRATNDGTAVLKCSWFGIDCGAERAQKDYGKLNGGDRYWFLPGDSFTFEQQINVSDQDIANGSIKRTLLVGGEIWVSKENGEIIVMANQAEMNNYASRKLSGVWSVSEGYEIPLVSKAPVHEVSIESRVVSTPEVNPEFYVPGEDIRYDVVLNNQSETDLINVAVKSSLSSSSVLTVDRIGAGETFVCGPYSYQATFDDAVGPLVNNVQVSFTYEDTQTADVLTAAPVEVWIGLHDGTLDITKTITNAPANGSFFTEGETIEYAVTISNGTNQEMRNVVVTDQLTGGSGSVETTLFETSVWEKDASQTLSYSYTVTAADVALGSVTNSALIHAENNIGLAWESVSEDVTVPVGGVREVLFETRVISTPVVMPGFYVPGETIYYEAVVTNNSNAALLNAEVETSLLPGVSLISSDRIEAGETLVCGPYTYQATFDDAVGPLVNTSQLTFTYEDTQASDVRSSSAEVWIGLNDGSLEITKSIANAPANGSFFTEGETIEYVITCTNATNEAMFDIVVTDMLTSGSGYTETILADSPAWAKGVSSSTGFSHTVTAEDVALGYVTNSALIHAVNNIGLHWESVSEAVTVPVGGVREVLFETRVISQPEVMPGFYVPGETIYYEAVVTNNSNAALLNAEVETSLLPGVSLISSDRIEAGETLVCGPYTYQATFDDAVGPLVNTSQLTFTYEDTQASDVRSSSAEVWIGLNDGTLEITKSIDNAPANGSFFTEGETIKYVITCTNATNEVIFDVVVTDMMTSGSGYSETTLSESPAWAKGVSANTGFSHTVTAEDVALGYVTNSALIHAVNNIGLHWETESEPVTALTGVAQTPAVPDSSEESKSDTVPETPADPKAPAAEQKPAASSDEAGVPLWLTISGTPVDGMVDRSPFATSASLYQAQLSGDEETGMVLSAASDEALGNQIIYIADLEDSGVFSTIGSLFNFEADPSQNTVFFGPKNAQAAYQIAALMRMNVSDEPFNLTNMTDLTSRAVYKVYQTALSMAPVRLQNVEVAYGDDMLTLVFWDQAHHGQCLVVVAKKQ